MVNPTTDASLSNAVRRIGRPLGSTDDLDALIDHIGNARYVLLGEASHGTSEYYTWRMRLSQRLIEEKGFTFIAVEGDWPDCYRVNRYIKGYPNAGRSARDVLHEFERWPTWMWANWEVAALAEWLRDYNAQRTDENKVGFYGLDVYSLWESLEEILSYLKGKDPDAYELAKRAYVCFQPYDRDVQAYAWATRLVPTSCENEVIDLLRKIGGRVTEAEKAFGSDSEATFNVEQNSLVAVNAERYYRAMVRGGEDSWNERDHHMVDTLDRLMNHFGANAKAIVWEHNTHIGDARATDMVMAGMVNVGQLARERHSEEGVVLVGAGSYQGTVIAGDSWGAPMEVMQVPAGREGSWEDVLHRTLGQDSLMIFSDAGGDRNLFQRTRDHRAIGVVYNPEHERFGNYVPTRLADRYDAFLYIDQSEALHPLHITPIPEPPELYPWGV
jgi:erythromycin esterase